MIYLDYAATTQMSEEALQTYIETSRYVFGNSQSLHPLGLTASSLLDTCRQKLASSLNGEKEGIIFTSGATEANALAIKTLLTSCKKVGNHLISTSIEHASVKNYLNYLATKGYEITFLPVDSNGKISLSQLNKAIKPHTILATIQCTNSEVGTIQPLKEIGALLRRKGILFHSDCAQGYGKIPIDIKELQIDSLSISSHKIYGPKGVGLCYINPKINRIPTIKGTTHEFGLRGGTIDLPAVAAFTTASEQRIKVMEKEYDCLLKLKTYFTTELGSFAQVIGDVNQTLPHIIGITISNIEGQYTLLACSRQNIMIGTGSACKVEFQEPSPVLMAIGKSSEEAKTFVRLSLGKDTTKEHLTKTLDVIKKIIECY